MSAHIFTTVIEHALNKNDPLFIVCKGFYLSKKNTTNKADNWSLTVCRYAICWSYFCCFLGDSDRGTVHGRGEEQGDPDQWPDQPLQGHRPKTPESLRQSAGPLYITGSESDLPLLHLLKVYFM